MRHPSGSKQTKDATAYLKIGDAARLAGISPSVIRSWERLGLTRPRRTASKYRMYTSEDVELLKRARFLRKVQLAQLCLATGNEAIAEPVLNDLAEEIDRRNLKEWELADVVAQPLTMLYRCLDRTPEAAQEKRELYARICRLYPARAVRLPR